MHILSDTLTVRREGKQIIHRSVVEKLYSRPLVLANTMVVPLSIWIPNL